MAKIEGWSKESLGNNEFGKEVILWSNPPMSLYFSYNPRGNADTPWNVTIQKNGVVTQDVKYFSTKKEAMSFASRYMRANPSYARSREERKQIANNIFLQFGAGRFVTMTGAKDFVVMESGLRFRIPRARDGINRVTITLTEMDDYTVEYERVRGTDYTVVRKTEGLYFDMLQEDFTRNTGLETSL